MIRIASVLVFLTIAACGGDTLHPTDAGKTDANVCVDNVDCIVGDHWDTTLCKCVKNDDLGDGCTTGCGGGGKGCSGSCPGGCDSGELCCAWAGGACLPDDAGMCNNGGFKCSTPTSQGVCPNQCYP